MVEASSVVDHFGTAPHRSLGFTSDTAPGGAVGRTRNFPPSGARKGDGPKRRLHCMDQAPTSPFRSDVHLAEVATAGVRFNLAVGDDIAAAALQPVARAAWGLVDNPRATGDLEGAVRAAEDALAMACGMSGERRFLADVVVYLDWDRQEPQAKPDDDLEAPSLDFAPTDDVDLEEARRLGAAAAAYLRAAAALSEAAVLFRVAASAIELDACGSEAIVDEVVARAPEVLEQAAAAYAQAVDLLSRSTAAVSPDVAFHIEELRVGVRALTMESVRLSPADDNADDPVDEPDSEDTDEATNHDMGGFCVDRAETFGVKARVMMAWAKWSWARADGLATPS